MLMELLKSIVEYFYLWLYSPWGTWLLFQFLNPYKVGMTP
jgi:hypothetical protein